MTVIEELAAERARQISAEGWTPEHDDERANGEIAAAASCYAASACLMACEPADAYPQGAPPAAWPWSQTWWKPRGARRDLIRAGALIVAEIERIDRAEAVLREAKNDSMERVGALALGWREKAERYETALMLIAECKGKTLLSGEHGHAYSVGANAAFEDCAALATAALATDAKAEASPS